MELTSPAAGAECEPPPQRLGPVLQHMLALAAAQQPPPPQPLAVHWAARSGCLLPIPEHLAPEAAPALLMWPDNNDAEAPKPVCQISVCAGTEDASVSVSTLEPAVLVIEEPNISIILFPAFQSSLPIFSCSNSIMSVCKLSSSPLFTRTSALPNRSFSQCSHSLLACICLQMAQAVQTPAKNPVGGTSVLNSAAQPAAVPGPIPTSNGPLLSISNGPLAAQSLPSEPFEAQPSSHPIAAQPSVLPPEVAMASSGSVARAAVALAHNSPSHAAKSAPQPVDSFEGEQEIAWPKLPLNTMVRIASEDFLQSLLFPRPSSCVIAWEAQFAR